MNKKLLQSVDLRKQNINGKKKISENNILIYYFHIRNLVELAYADQQIVKVFYSFFKVLVCRLCRTSLQALFLEKYAAKPQYCLKCLQYIYIIG